MIYNAVARRKLASIDIEKRGFTLIELLIVCALISIMLTISIPSFRNLIINDPLKSSARKIIGLVGEVRELSLRTHQPYFLTISRLDNRIWYERDSSQEPSEDLSIDSLRDSMRDSTRDRKKKDREEGSQNGKLQLPEEIQIKEVRTVGDTIMSTEPIVLWVTGQGYLVHTIIRIENKNGEGITLQFFPFINSVQVSDKSTSLNK